MRQLKVREVVRPLWFAVVERKDVSFEMKLHLDIVEKRRRPVRNPDDGRAKLACCDLGERRCPCCAEPRLPTVDRFEVLLLGTLLRLHQGTHYWRQAIDGGPVGR